MATKKTASTAKKSVKKAPAKAAKATTKVTTTTKTVAASSTTKFSFSRSPILAASVAEFIGTFLLAMVVLTTQGNPLYVLFTLVGIILAVGAVSGSHVNPILTIGAWATRRIKSARAVSYIVAQVLGALMALVVANAYIGAAPEAAPQVNFLGQQQATNPELFSLGEIAKDREWLLLAAELLGGALFAFGFASATREKSRLTVAFTVGISLFIALMVTSYLTGLVTSGGQELGSAVLNPAIAGTLQGVSWSLWPIAIYVLAPVVGSVIGFVVRDLLRDESEAKA